MGTWPIAYSDVLKARDRIRPHLQKTPLRAYAPLDAEVGHGVRVLVKHENHNPTNSFKVRNGLSFMTAQTGEARRRGVVAATRGNHGLGLAWAGSLLGARVTICVPRGNNPKKNEAMRATASRSSRRDAITTRSCVWRSASCASAVWSWPTRPTSPWSSPARPR